MLEKLCMTNGTSGDEEAVRTVIIENIKPYADSIIKDTLGNIIAYKKGKSEKRIMLSAHMDEVGFIITDIDESGFLKFTEVGGIDPRVLPGKRVTVGKNTKGVIGIKPIHLQSDDEKGKAPAYGDLSIDIGAKDKEDAFKYVSIGDYAYFDTPFLKIGKDAFSGKAFDDRVGILALIEAMKVKNIYDTYFAFTVSEEIGTRGSACATRRINPDIAVVFEGTTCSDVADISAENEVTSMGGGAALSITDRGSYADRELTKLIYSEAERRNIPVQYKRTNMGGNDARSIQVSGGGVKVSAVSVPVRYLHSPVGIISDSDLDAALDIAKMIVGDMIF